MNEKIGKAMALLEQGYGYFHYNMMDHADEEDPVNRLRIAYRPVRVGFNKYKAVCGWIVQNGTEDRVSIENVYLEPLPGAVLSYCYEDNQ